MTEYRSPYGNEPITLQQKQTLIAAYQQTGNMTQAMREADIRSPKTAYLWWRRFCEGGEAALEPRSHTRHTQQRLSEVVVEEICHLRRQQPAWGRRQIAHTLSQRYGWQVASPASVEAVLRRAGLWEQAPQPVPATHPPGIPFWLRKGIDQEGLLEAVQRGILLSVRGEARAATQILYREIWHPLEIDVARWSRLLRTPEIGRWLLSSRLHLGHCLMNSGHRHQAARYLGETIVWMQEHPEEPRQRPWGDTPHFVSLRYDDIWLGCYQHLGLVEGKEDVKAGLAYLQTALTGVRRTSHPIVPSDSAMLGDLERDLAHLKLKLRYLPEAEVRQHLHLAQQHAEEAGAPGVQAFTHLAWAKLSDRLALEASEHEQGTRRQQRQVIEQAIERALQLVEREQEDRPMRQTLCFVDAAQLAQAHGMPVDGQRIQRAAQYCLTYGYGHQAQELLAIPGIHAWLPEETQRNLTGLA